MKIILVSFSEHYTFQEVIYNLKIELEKSKDFDVWTIGNRNLMFNDFIKDDKNIFITCPPRPGITKETLNFVLLKKVRKEIKKINPDLILFYSIHTWNIILNLQLRKEYKFIHTIHDVIPHEGDKVAKFVFYYNKLISKLADKIMVHSNMFVDVFQEKYKCKPEKIVYTGLFRKFDDFYPLNHTKRCLFFGRLNHYKGIDALIKIIELNKHIYFDIVGKPDIGMELYIKKLTEFNNVRIDSDYVDEEKMKNYFYNSDVVILPYKTATQSGVIVDAYKYSRPVIAFNVGGISEQVENNVSGYLIENHDINLFSKALNQYLDLSNLDKEILSKNSWEYGYKKYAIQNSTKRLLEIIKNK